MAISQKGWTIGGVAAGIAIVGLTYFVGVGPERSHASSVTAQTTAAKEANDALAAQINSLRAQSKNLGNLTTRLSAEQVAVPSEHNMADFIREVHTLAVADGLVVKSVNISSPTLTGPGSTTDASTQVPGQAAGRLFQIPISIAVSGVARHEVQFVASLHAMGSRAALINSVQTTWTSDAASYLADMTLELDVFVAPQTAAQEAALEKDLSSS